MKLINTLLFIFIAFAIFLILPFACKAQDVYSGCPMMGDKAGRTAILDSLKNRYVIPGKYSPINFNEMASMTVDTKKHTAHEAVEIQGYVVEVKYGGSETCNCHTKDKTLFDTHIVLMVDDKQHGRGEGVVVEISPRIRAMMAAKGIDWTTNNIKKCFLNKWVTVSGYLFDDEEHKQNSTADSPHGTNNWRATCWEVHPVTDIQFAKP